jgi:hypothetical protein
VSTSMECRPAARISRRLTSADPSSPRRLRYSAVGACSGRSRTGAHHRRMARPMGESSGEQPGRAGSRLSDASASNSVGVRSWVTTPWQ